MNCGLGWKKRRISLRMRQVSRTVIKRWGGVTRLQAVLSHTNRCCGTGSLFVGYHWLVHLLLGSSASCTIWCWGENEESNRRHVCKLREKRCTMMFDIGN